MKNVGREGEEKAAEYLVKKGYRIVTRNYRWVGGEIDIIAEFDGFLSFVEVKSRSSNSGGRPAEAVTATKKNRLRSTAEYWLFLNPTELQPRFDVIEIIFDKNGCLLEVTHFENAFF